MLRFGVLLLALLPACSAIVTPDPNRLGGGLDAATAEPDAPGNDDDAPIGLDTFVEVDAPPIPCADGCPDGEVCEGGVCVCPDGACCPACTAPEVCLDGTCGLCGATGEPCC